MGTIEQDYKDHRTKVYADACDKRIATLEQELKKAEDRNVDPDELDNKWTLLVDKKDAEIDRFQAEAKRLRKVLKVKDGYLWHIRGHATHLTGGTRVAELCCEALNIKMEALAAERTTETEG